MKHIDNATSLEFEVRGKDKYYCVDTHELFEKDCSGQWWVNMWGGGERGPFNSLEHACDCTCSFYGI